MDHERLLCKTCQILFSNRRERNSHVQSDHPELAAKEDLDNELETDEDAQLANVTGRTGFPCRECGSEFGSEAILNLHLKSAHDRIVEYRCAKCQDEDGEEATVKFSLVNRLLKHFRDEHMY